jgi:hypothetical protein
LHFALIGAGFFGCRAFGRTPRARAGGRLTPAPTRSESRHSTGALFSRLERGGWILSRSDSRLGILELGERVGRGEEKDGRKAGGASAKGADGPPLQVRILMAMAPRIFGLPLHILLFAGALQLRSGQTCGRLGRASPAFWGLRATGDIVSSEYCYVNSTLRRIWEAYICAFVSTGGVIIPRLGAKDRIENRRRETGGPRAEQWNSRHGSFSGERQKCGRAYCFAPC